MADVLLSVKTLLDNSWISGNTASRTPTIQPIFEVKRLDFTMQGSQDHILLYEITRVPSDSASGAGSKKITSVVNVDIRTILSRVQLDLMRVEVRRIFNSNQTDPFSDQVYDIMDITDDQDLSDKSIKLFRVQIQIQLEQFNISI